MSHILTVDPGLSSGIFLGHYSDTEPLTRVAVWQFGSKGDSVRGVEALLLWFTSPNYSVLWDDLTIGGHKISGNLTIIAEKFTPLSGQGHSLTLDAVEPLRCEGALIAKGLMPAEFPHERWQRPDRMYFNGGATKPERLKRSRAWLKERELLPVGKDVGQPDANDAVSATLHAFAYMRKMGHTPTIERYWPDEMKED